MTDPQQESLIASLRALEPPILTFMIERLGRLVVEMLDHPSALVREGALTGLDGALFSIRNCAGHDKSAAVRELAQDMLDE